MPIFSAILSLMCLICFFDVKFSSKKYFRRELIQIIESGHYLYIVLEEPGEYCLFCLAYEKNICFYLFTFFLHLTISFSMFSFDPPENVRKTFGFLIFSGGSKRNIGKKRVKDYLLGMRHCETFCNSLFTFSNKVSISYSA